MGTCAWPCPTPRVQVCNTGATECFTGWWWENSMNTPRWCWDLRQHHWCGHWGGGACARPETKEKACIPGRKLAADDSGFGTQYGWEDAMEIRSRKQLLLLSSCLPSPFQKSLGTKPEQKPPGVPSQGKKIGSKIKEAGGQHTEKGNSNHPSYPTLPHCLLGSYTAKWLYIS